MPVIDLKKSKLINKINNLKSKNILVIGDSGIDTYITGETTRLSPEAPVPVLLRKNEMSTLGLAANVAINLKKFGMNPFLFTVTGSDSQSNHFKDLLKLSGIATDNIFIDLTRPTIIKTRFLSDHHHLLRVDSESTHQINEILQKEICKSISNILPNMDGVIIQDHHKGVITYNICKFLLKKCQDKIPIFVDPSSKTNPAYYTGATVFKPNRQEATAIVGKHSVDEMAGKIHCEIQPTYVCITLGSEGSYVYDGLKSEGQYIKTIERKVYDVSGAGDTLISVLASCYTNNLDIYESVQIANYAAGIVVGKVGTATVSKEETIQELKNQE